MLLICAILLDAASIGGSMIGSLLLASNSGYSKWGYIFFLIGTTASILIMLRSNVRRSQVFINFWFLGVNAFGIFRWFHL
jgi:F0F1-type ATP synthase assembly protein I